MHNLCVRYTAETVHYRTHLRTNFTISSYEHCLQPLCRRKQHSELVLHANRKFDVLQVASLEVRAHKQYSLVLMLDVPQDIILFCFVLSFGGRGDLLIEAVFYYTDPQYNATDIIVGPFTTHTLICK